MGKDDGQDRSGMDLFKRCEAEYKEEVMRIGQELPRWFEKYVANAKPSDPVVELYNVYRMHTGLSALMGAGVSLGLAHAVTSRLSPLPRIAALVGFSGMGGMMGAMAGSSAAQSQLVKKSIKYIPTTDWAPALACRPIYKLKDCVQDEDCKQLMSSKVIGGKVLINAYYACRQRADKWATDDERLRMMEEEGAAAAETGSLRDEAPSGDFMSTTVALDAASELRGAK